MVERRVMASDMPIGAAICCGNGILVIRVGFGQGSGAGEQLRAVGVCVLVVPAPPTVRWAAA
jgi:hypothetical protein